MFFDAKDQIYKEFDIVKETIKVRFGSDIDIEIKHTSNGVVLPADFLDGLANNIMVWLPREILPS